jgi:hypothetical protein
MEKGATDGRDNTARRGAMDKPRLVYVPREDATPEGELSALAAVYAYVLECHERNEVAADVGEDEGRTEDGREGGAPEKHPAKEDSA